MWGAAVKVLSKVGSGIAKVGRGIGRGLKRGFRKLKSGLFKGGVDVEDESTHDIDQIPEPEPTKHKKKSKIPDISRGDKSNVNDSLKESGVYDEVEKESKDKIDFKSGNDAEDQLKDYSTELKNRKEELDRQLENGEIDQDEYISQLADAEHKAEENRIQLENAKDEEAKKFNADLQRSSMEHEEQLHEQDEGDESDKQQTLLQRITDFGKVQLLAIKQSTLATARNLNPITLIANQVNGIISFIKSLDPMQLIVLAALIITSMIAKNLQKIKEYIGSDNSVLASAIRYAIMGITKGLKFVLIGVNDILSTLDNLKDAIFKAFSKLPGLGEYFKSWNYTVHKEYTEGTDENGKDVKYVTEFRKFPDGTVKAVDRYTVSDKEFKRVQRLTGNSYREVKDGDDYVRFVRKGNKSALWDKVPEGGYNLSYRETHMGDTSEISRDPHQKSYDDLENTYQTMADIQNGIESQGIEGIFSGNMSASDLSVGDLDKVNLTKSQQDKIKGIIDYLCQKLGLKPWQAAGLVGNWIAESGLVAGKYNPAGGGYGAQGIAQWRGNRVKNYVNKYGKQPRFDKNINHEIEFAADELLSSYKSGLDKLKKTNTPEEAANVVLASYEFSYGSYADMKENGPSDGVYVNSFNPQGRRTNAKWIADNLYTGNNKHIIGTKTKDNSTTPKDKINPGHKKINISKSVAKSKDTISKNYEAPKASAGGWNGLAELGPIKEIDPNADMKQQISAMQNQMDNLVAMTSNNAKPNITNVNNNMQIKGDQKIDMDPPNVIDYV